VTNLHAVFKDYRIRGEWFDLSPLGDPVQAVKGEIREASERLARGEALLSANRHHDNSPRPALKTFDETPNEVTRDPGMRQWRVVFAPAPHNQSWEERFPTSAGRPGIAKLKVVRESATGHDPRPGCIRAWQGRCHRPAGTTCGC
jgi:hypothetical protein